jgi:hypothetical protein
MLTIIIIVALFIVLDIAALRWGFDSSERVNSCEWERRAHGYSSVDDQWMAC